MVVLGEIMFKLLYDHWHSGGVLHVDAVVLLALLPVNLQQPREGFHLGEFSIGSRNWRRMFSPCQCLIR